MHIYVRQVRHEDWSELQQIFLLTRRQNYLWLDSDNFQLIDLDDQTRGETIFVAEDGRQEIVGFISVQEEGGFIHHLFVKSDRQRSGVGKALLRNLPGWLERKYTLKCIKLNHNAAAFYRTCGFTEAGFGTAKDGEYILFERGKA